MSWTNHNYFLSTPNHSHSVASQEFGIEYTKDEDGLYYFSSIGKVYETAYNYCNRMPGFGLPIILTQKQWDTMTARITMGKVYYG